MIKRISWIKNLILFNDYEWGDHVEDKNPLKEFKRFNFFYGANGSGKSIFCKLLNHISNKDNIDQPLSGLEYGFHFNDKKMKHTEKIIPEIKIFNEEYVKNNIYFMESKVDSILITGKKNIGYIKELEVLESDIIETNNELNSQKKELVDKQLNLKNKFTGVAKLIKETTSRNNSNYNKKNAKIDFENFQLNNDFDGYRALKFDDLSVKKNFVLSDSKKEIINEFIIDYVEFNEIKNLYIQTVKICNKQIEISEINKLMDDSRLSNWVEEGLSYIESDQKCGFCLSDISDKRIEKLNKHFTAEGARVKEQIDLKINEIKDILETLQKKNVPNEVYFYDKQKEKIKSLIEIFEEKKQKFKEDFFLIIELLKLKKQKISEVVATTTISEEILKNAFSDLIKSVNIEIVKHNLTVNNHESEIKKFDNEIKKDYLFKESSEIKKLKNEENFFLFEIITCEKKLKSLIDRQKHLTDRLSSEDEGIKKLNEEIKFLIGRDEILFEKSSDIDGGFEIKRNGIKIKNNISEGERTAIALAYFFVHLEDKDSDIEKEIIIIDDPVSSLDEDTLYQIFSSIKDKVSKALQVFIFTHNFYFLKLIIDWGKYFKKNDCSLYMIKNKNDKHSNNKRIAYLENLNKVFTEFDNDYQFLFKILYDFKNSQEVLSWENVYNIPTIARKFLEHFLKFFIPVNESLYKKMKKNEIKLSEVKKTALYKFVNELSHSSRAEFDPEIPKKSLLAVGYLFDMLKNSAPNHYEYLNEAIKF